MAFLKKQTALLHCSICKTFVKCTSFNQQMKAHWVFSIYIYLKVNLLSPTIKSSKSSLCVKTENNLLYFSILKYNPFSLKPKIRICLFLWLQQWVALMAKIKRSIGYGNTVLLNLINILKNNFEMTVQSQCHNWKPEIM